MRERIWLDEAGVITEKQWDRIGKPGWWDVVVRLQLDDAKADLIEALMRWADDGGRP